MKKYCGINCNEKFLEIYTCSYCWGADKDPLGEDIYLETLADYKVVGEAFLKALSKSRDLSISGEDQQALMNERVTDEWIDKKYPETLLFSLPACIERGKKWIEYAMKEYRYKTKTALLKNMQYISAEDDGENILFSSKYHLTVDSWGDPDGKTPSIEMKIPSNSSVEVIGAATQYAIGNCRGKGADFVRNLLFPEGQPETFEEYIKQLGI